MLDDAALEAVKQWRFQPTIIDGRAVPPRLTVTVNFTLQKK
jgi:TonB family protein